MKKLYVLFALISVPVAFFFGCKHEPVLPEHQVSFSQEVLPIIQLGCQHAGCHGDSLNQEHKLVDYNDVMDFGEVEPGKPHSSKLYTVLFETDPEERMPRDPYPPLTDRNQKLIFIWIAQGAKNN